jgi:oxygen-dependent protoporphyrinogen oxidase
MKDKTESPIVVIGAGLSGLAAARHLTQAGLRVIVLESDKRVGGRIYTDRTDGFEIDAGGQFIASFYTHTLRLIRELNLEPDLVRIASVSAVLRERKLYRIWPNLRVIFTGLISVWSKLLLLRPAFDALRHWSLLDIYAFHKAFPLDTASVTDYASRRLNREILEYILQPPLSGILYWEPETTSQAMLFPLLKVAAGVKLMTLRHGLGQLVEAMAEGVDIRYGAEVTQVLQDGADRYLVKYEQEDQMHEVVTRGVVCSIPASGVPGVFPQLSDHQRRFFQAIEYSENAICAVGIDRRMPDGIYGLLFPRQEAKHLAIAAVQSAKNPAQLPTGRDMVVLYPNGPAGRQLIDQSDDEIGRILKSELNLAGDAYRIGNDEIIQRVYRWRQALPFFDVGHFERLHDFAVGNIESGCQVFAGDYLGGPFIEGAINSGILAANRLVSRLS